jgi:hypothetical protein
MEKDLLEKAVVLQVVTFIAYFMESCPLHQPFIDPLLYRLNSLLTP